MCFDSQSPGGFSIAFEEAENFRSRDKKEEGFLSGGLDVCMVLGLDLAFMMYRLMTFSSLEGEQKFTFDNVLSKQRYLCSMTTSYC